jgi:subtilisin family serine protease
MSLGGGRSSALDIAVRSAVADGVVFVVAAGNSTANACQSSPAGEPLAITVGATTSADARSSFSNYGSCVDVFAPGSSITSAWYTSTTASNTISGTSMASPHVAGVVALGLEIAPNSSVAQISEWITSTATQGVISNAGSGSPNLLVYSRLSATPPVAAAPSTTSTLPRLLHRLQPLRLRFHRVAEAVMTVVVVVAAVITAVAVMTQHPRRQQQQLLAQLLQHQQCHHQLFRNLWCPRHLLDRARRYP